MNLPRLSVRRPVFTTMATLIVLTLGAFALSRLQIDLLPDVELPTVSVRTGYPGASPEVVERLVTQIVEEIVATVEGVEEITSESSEGSSRVRLTFGFGTDVDSAALEVRSKLEEELQELPEEIDRPRVDKFDVDSSPVVILGIFGELSPVELTEIADNQIRYRFGRLPGVAQVDLWGGDAREIRVELQPDKLKALGLPLNTVLSAIRDSNVDLPAGEIEEGRYTVTLRAPGEFKSVEEIGATVVAVRDGAGVRLRDVANVVDAAERPNRIIRINGEPQNGLSVPGIRVAIRKQADANTVEVADAILKEIEAVNQDFGQVRVVAVSNQGNFIERSIANVTRSVLYGGGLAVLVLLFFLRNLRSTFVIALAIPISIIATFAMIYFGGLTLNLMTLGGLALGVGMMVDNAIVVLENIYRRRDEEGENAADAAVHGTAEVGPAIVASTVTTLVIFLPLAFVRGVSGVLFSSLALVVVFSLTCSLIVSLTAVPMLAAKLLKSPAEVAASRPRWLSKIVGVSDRGFALLDTAYRDTLRLALRFRWLVIGGTVAAVAASTLLYPLLGSEFLPPSDEGEVRLDARFDPGTRLELVDAKMRELEPDLVRSIPEVDSYVMSTGGWGNDITFALIPVDERTRSNIEIADELRERISGTVPGIEFRVNAPQGQRTLERLFGGNEGESLRVEVRGYDLAELNRLAAQAAEVMEEVPGIEDVRLDLEEGARQQEVYIDREKAADLGVSLRQVADVLRIAVAGTQAGEFRTGGTSHPILVQIADVRSVQVDDLLDLTIRTPAGVDVALRNLVEVRPGRGPEEIDRRDQQRTVGVSANVAGRDLGSTATELQEKLRDIVRPTGYDLTVRGAFEEQQKARVELLTTVGLAIALVYMVLACQYESLRDPLIVMTSVPAAAIGVLVTLYLTDTTLNVQSYIGCVMLGGIVVNNAILLVDQAGQLRTAGGLGSKEAVVEAGRRRLRPILMTTLTTILALVPLALGLGEGADAQAPLARAVIGGLVASTLITLVIVPAVYTLIHRDGPRKEAFAA